MITSIKKVNYTIVELDKTDLLELLLGGTIEEEVNRCGEECDPTLFRVYCSSPTTIPQLINHLTLMEKNYEKKSKGPRSQEED